MDTTKFREQDVPYVQDVVDYLSKCDLKVELVGSVLKGDKTYHDIDLLAKGSLEAVSDAMSGLDGLEAKTAPFPKRAANGVAYIVFPVGGLDRYAGTSIDNRFLIIAGETEIDVSLKIEGLNLGPFV